MPENDAGARTGKRNWRIYERLFMVLRLKKV